MKKFCSMHVHHNDKSTYRALVVVARKSLSFDISSSCAASMVVTCTANTRNVLPSTRTLASWCCSPATARTSTTSGAGGRSHLTGLGGIRNSFLHNSPSRISSLIIQKNLITILSVFFGVEVEVFALDVYCTCTQQR